MFRAPLWLALALTVGACSAVRSPCSATSDCPIDQACVGGFCAGCSHCPDGADCLRGQCLRPSCGNHFCAADQACVAGECTDALCVQKVCGAGESCAKGTCYPQQCAGVSCLAGELCIDGQCQQPACLGVSCPAGETCVAGACLRQSCENAVCGAGAVCENGRCVHRACLGTVCPSGSECVSGFCVPTSCGTTQCAPGSACVNNECVDARCKGVSCSATQRCSGGACSACEAEETDCADGKDNDCDGKIDCADPACVSKSCDDKNVCTMGETCTAAGACMRGTPTVCASPTNACSRPTGTCEPGIGCVYPPRPQGEPCPNAPCLDGRACDGKGTCVGGTQKVCPPPSQCQLGAGTCDPVTGACSYAPKPVGTVCDDANLCTTGDACDGKGACSGAAVRCDTPTACQNGPGTCSPSTGSCSYTAKVRGTPCSDNNACTVGDDCDGAGTCRPGLVCPSSKFCETGACVAGTCRFTAKQDGISCGAAESLRCCNANCVDISKDAQNCGGCGTVCGASFACESVGDTNTCPDAPVSTSARCRCNDSPDCPRGQRCRGGQPTFNGRCGPLSDMACAPGERQVVVNTCPAYCRY
ncbi:MAG: hypothetical protein ACT4TC_19855 [Myxococcaceae bacterium]